MSLDAEFSQAQSRVKTLKNRPNNPDLLELYALFKQGTDGDVQGKRPRMIDIKGRAKFDAWAGKKGMKTEEAKSAYVALVERLLTHN